MDAKLQAELDQIMADWMALTHEDIQEMAEREGRGCKACDATHSSCSWWRGSGDIYCYTCALELERELGDVTFTRVETREQRDTLAAWAAAGIGAN